MRTYELNNTGFYKFTLNLMRFDNTYHLHQKKLFRDQDNKFYQTKSNFVQIIISLISIRDLHEEMAEPVQYGLFRSKIIRKIKQFCENLTTWLLVII